MTEAEQAAIDLLQKMQRKLSEMQDDRAAKDEQLSALTAELTALRASDDAMAAVAEASDWFDAFCAAADAPAQGHSEEQPAEQSA